MDLAAFERQQFHPRTAGVDVKALEPWLLKDGEERTEEGPVQWQVRGLTYEELARVELAVQRPEQMAALVNAFASQDKRDLSQAVKDALGYGVDVPPDMVKRIQLLIAGSVDPEVTEGQAVKLASVFPVEFKLLTNKIIELTGLGQEPGKPRGSGPEPT